MASEIRANKSTNRAGLGTVTYADTGIIVSGIVTCTELSGLSALNISGVGTANTLDINGDIDVDGHTNLDNVSVAGVSTFSGDIIAKTPTQYKGFTLRKADGGTVAQLVGHASDNDEGGLNLWDGGTKKVQILANGTSYLNGGTVGINDSSPNTYFKLDVNGHTNIVGDIALPTTNRIYWGNSDTAFIKGEHGGSAYLSFGANNEKMRLTRAGYLGIGTEVPTAHLNVFNPTTLGGTVSNRQDLARFEGHVGNDGMLEFSNVRIANGTDWTTSAFRIQRRIDSTRMGYIDFGTGTGSGAGGAGRDIQFASGDGTLMMHLDSLGRVGIGTDAPNSELEVFSDTFSDFTINSARTSGNIGGLNFRKGGAAGGLLVAQYIVDTNGSHYFFSQGSQRLQISSAGVFQTVTRSAEVRRAILSGSPSNSAFNIEAHDGETGTSSGDVQGKLGLFYNDGSTLSNTACISFERGSGAHDGAMAFVTNQAERLRITSDGKMGLGSGITSPIGNFEIYNSSGISSCVVRGPKALVAIMGDSDNSGASETDASLMFTSDSHTILNSPLSAHGFEIALINEEPGAGLRFHDGTSNAERLRITSNGTLAYNYDGANASLVGGVDIRSNSGVHIRGTDGNTNNTNIYLGGSSTNQRKCAIIFDPVGGYCRGDLHFCMDNTGDLSDVTVSDTKMVMKADGKIGIGIDNPAGQLHVSSGTLGDCVLILEADTDNNQENDNPYIEFRQDGGIAASVIGQNPYNVTDDNNALFLSNSITNGAIIFKTGSSNGHSNATERLRIKSDGTTLFNCTSVNAGGASPTLALDVGDSNLHGVIIQAGGGENSGDLSGLAFAHGATGTIARPKAAIALNASGSYGRGDLCFYVDGASDNNAVAAGDERMRIKENGQVIISNSNPPASGPMMHVTDDGSATTIGTTSTFRVSNDGGSASYSVFEAQSGSGSIRLANDGQFYITGYIKASNQLFIRNNAPTIYLQDTDHNSAMIHQNSGLFYVLRGSGNDSTTWVQYNGHWPMYIRMDNNRAYFGGNVYSAGTLLTGSSDLRLKKNLVKIQTPLEKISKLTGYNFDWNDNVTELGFTPDIPTNDVGLIAQDVQEVAPQAVQHAPFDQVYDKETKLQKSKSGEKYLTVQYEKLVPLLVEAIKELKAEVDALKSS